MRRLTAALGGFAAAIAAALGLSADDAPPDPAPQGGTVEHAVFAGGCFWCVEADFDKLDGVVETVSGYAGGTVENPTYKQVTAGGTGHAEVVRVAYDPSVISFRALVDHFWRTVDPLDAGGQFCDRGASYRTEVFVSGPEQRAAAEASKADAEAALGEAFVTAITALEAFYPAEDYHQDYYKKNPLRYRYYRLACGRDARVKRLWGQAASG